MKGFLSIFQESAKELFKIRTLTVTAVLVALYVILKIFSIDLGTYAKIGFSFLPLAIIGMLFGPSVGMFAGMLCDVLGFLVRPQGGYLFLLTLVAMVSGLIYGAFLYKKEGKQLIKAIIISRLVVSVISNIILNTLALMYYGIIPANITDKAMLVRVIKNAVEYPIYTALMISVLPAVLIIYKKAFKMNRT